MRPGTTKKSGRATLPPNQPVLLRITDQVKGRIIYDAVIPAWVGPLLRAAEQLGISAEELVMAGFRKKLNEIKPKPPEMGKRAELRAN